jgi:glycosyltransferase involved in cell wall biosynthesis
MIEDRASEHRISVVMPAYNSARFMPEVLAPLIEMLNRRQIDELLVVDDQSTDNTAAVAEALGATVIRNPRRGGPGAARNLAAQYAKGDILWFVDADVIAWPGGPDQIRPFFADPSVVAVFGSYDDSPPGSSWISQYKNLTHRYYHQRGKEEASTFWAGCGAVRKDAFLAVGGFDTATYPRPSIEDIDLGYRLRSQGGRILLLPDLLGKHLKVWTVRNVIQTDIFLRAIPWSRLLISREGMTDELNVSNGERARAVLAGLLILSFLAFPFMPALWPVALAMVGVVVFANWHFFRFLQRNGSVSFALAGLAYHQLYYLYSMAAFAWCFAESVFVQRHKPA